MGHLNGPERAGIACSHTTHPGRAGTRTWVFLPSEQGSLSAMWLSKVLNNPASSPSSELPLSEHLLSVSNMHTSWPLPNSQHKVTETGHTPCHVARTRQGQDLSPGLSELKTGGLSTMPDCPGHWWLWRVLGMERGGGFSLPPTWMVSPLFPSRCTPLAGSLPSSVSLCISSLPSQHPPLYTVDIQHLFADHSFSEVRYKSPLGRGGWGQRALGFQSNSDIS